MTLEFEVSTMTKRCGERGLRERSNRTSVKMDQSQPVTLDSPVPGLKLRARKSHAGPEPLIRREHAADTVGGSLRDLSSLQCPEQRPGSYVLLFGIRVTYLEVRGES